MTILVRQVQTLFKGLRWVAVIPGFHLDTCYGDSKKEVVAKARLIIKEYEQVKL